MAIPPTPNKNLSSGGGCLIAAGLILGPVIGLFLGQVSAGLVIGGFVGIVAAILWAVQDSRK
jgi:mannose/fructose/N-acetylgalactosamine-specific phosphotransferase system component IIC